jgi:hypothetical protein
MTGNDNTEQLTRHPLHCLPPMRDCSARRCEAEVQQELSGSTAEVEATRIRQVIPNIIPSQALLVQLIHPKQLICFVSVVMVGNMIQWATMKQSSAALGASGAQLVVQIDLYQ